MRLLQRKFQKKQKKRSIPVSRIIKQSLFRWRQIYGYEVAGAELDEIYEKAAAEISDEELGKVAGGTTPTCYVMASIAITISGVIFTIESKDNKIEENYSYPV